MMPAEPGFAGLARLFKIAMGTADASGNVTLAFDGVASAQSWGGAVFTAAPQPTLAQFVVRRDGQYMGTYSGFGTLSDVQAHDGGQVTVTGSALSPGDQVTVIWQGRIDPIGQAPVMTPFVSGPVGFQTVVSSPSFPLGTTAIRSQQPLGTPLAGSTLAAGTTATLFNGPVTSIAYEVAMDALCQAVPAAPFIKGAFIWKDGSGGNTLQLQHWIMLQTNVSAARDNALICGHGPADASWLTVLAHNYDSADSTIDFELFETSEPFTRHSLSSVSNNILGNYTYGGQTFSTPVSDPAALIMGNTPLLAINPGLTAARINALYAGKCQLNVEQAAPFAGAVTVYAVHPDFAVPLQIIYSSVMPASGNLQVADLTIPRTPTVIVLSNTSGAPGAYQYSLVPQEVAAG